MNGNDVTITWDDGHVSPFTADWLRDHSFTEHAQNKLQNALGRKPKLWGPDLQDGYPISSFSKVLR